MQVTIRFANNASEAVDRALGCVLLTTEAATARHLIGGFYFETKRDMAQIIAAFEEEGFEPASDFDNIEFDWRS